MCDKVKTQEKIQKKKERNITSENDIDGLIKTLIRAMTCFLCENKTFVLDKEKKYCRD